MAVTDALQWWRDTLDGKNPPVTTTPEAGWFVMKAHGTMIPASIWWESPQVDEETGEILADQVLCAEVGGKEMNPDDIWLSVAKRPVERCEYEYWLGQLVSEDIG